VAEKLKVYHFPILHTDREACIDEALGQFWNQQGADLDTRPYWQQIRDYLATQRIDYKKTKIYQDSHPIEAQDIYGVGVEALDYSMVPGPNQQMLTELIEKGAKLLGTESTELVLESYRHREEMLGSIDRSDLAGSLLRVQAASEKLGRLVPLRDRAIAHRIRQTLGPSETGILFLGRDHNIKAHAKGINLVTPPHIKALADQLG
jgi:hypothetical protein